MTEVVDESGEDRRKHLDYIQAIVTRMSAASSNAKGWLLPVVTAAFGFALTERSRSVALLGLLAVVLFMFLDANYLRQERAYRRLYDAVASGTEDIPKFSLDPSVAEESPQRSDGWTGKARLLLARWIPPWCVWRSWSILPFYGTLIIVGIGVSVWISIG